MQLRNKFICYFLCRNYWSMTGMTNTTGFACRNIFHITCLIHIISILPFKFFKKKNSIYE